MRSRLSTILPEVAELIQAVDDGRNRRAAMSSVEFALQRTGLVDSCIDELLTSVNSGRYGDTPERLAVGDLVTQLDEHHWSVQDQVDVGEASADDQPAAFQRARAAAAVFSMADEDARFAATEAIYEASAAVSDVDALRTVVLRELLAG